MSRREGVQRYDVFLCHAGPDKDWTAQLAHRLDKEGISTFFDLNDMAAGDSVILRMDEGLEASRLVVVILGRELGRHQEKEIRMAVQMHTELGRPQIIPILLPGASEDELPGSIREFRRVFFSTDPLADERAFADLLDGIQRHLASLGAAPQRSRPRITDLIELQALAQRRLRSLLQSRKGRDGSEFAQKYLSPVFHQRGGADDLFQDFLYQQEKRCFVVVGKAGKGKTNLICHFAEELPKQADDFLPVLLSANELHIGSRSLETAIEKSLVGRARGRVSRLRFNELCDYLKDESATLVVFVDGINELEGSGASEAFSQEIESLIPTIERYEFPVVFCLSCRTEGWPKFRHRAWAQDHIFARSRSDTSAGSASLHVGDFQLSEIDEISQRYFKWYGIRGRLTRSARRNCCDPIMLRYLCAAHTNRAATDWKTPARQIPIKNIRTIETLRRKEVFDKFVENRRAIMAQAVRRLLDIHDEEIIDRVTTQYLISMAYTMYQKGRSYLEIPEAIEVARSLEHPDAQLADRDRNLFLRDERSVFYRFIDEGIILSKISSGSFNFTFESYFEYSLGRYFSRIRWPERFAEGGEKAVLDDLSRLLTEHEELVESRDFNNLFGALHYAILDVEQRPIRGSHEDFFIELIEQMSRSSSQGFDWVQLACATLRETGVAQPATSRRKASDEAQAALETRRRRFERLLGVLDHLTMTSEFLLIWDLEPTLVALAAAHREATLERIQEWAESSERHLQQIFAIHSLARLALDDPDAVATILIDLSQGRAYTEDFWLTRGWIGAARKVTDLSSLERKLRRKLIDIIERLTTESRSPTVRALAFANLPILASSRPRILSRVEKNLERESWIWARWNLAFELRFWHMDYGRSWPWKLLEKLSIIDDEHLRYVVESTLWHLKDSNPKVAARIEDNLKGARWRLEDEEAGNSDSRIGIVYSPAFLEPAYDNHVECRERIQVIISLLEEVAGPHFRWVLPRQAKPSELSRAHGPEIDQHRDRSPWLHYLEEVEETSKSLENPSEASNLRTGPSELRYESYKVAKLSAGAAIRAVNYVLNGPARFAMALNRPPGHLANNTVCILNNIAIAAKAAREKKLGRLFILDFDAHHGYHTYRVFRRDPETIYCSIHIDGDYAKFAGLPRHTGEGAGEGYNFNINYPPSTSDEDYAYIVDAFLIPLIRQYRPELILLSAGFDGHFDDPLTGGRLTEDAYIHLAERVLGIAEELDIKIAGSFEGGYGLDGMRRSLLHMLRIFGRWPLDPEAVGWVDRSELPEDPNPEATHAGVRQVVRERVRLMAARAASDSSSDTEYAFDTRAECWQRILAGKG